MPVAKVQHSFHSEPQMAWRQLAQKARALNQRALRPSICTAGAPLQHRPTRAGINVETPFQGFPAAYGGHSAVSGSCSSRGYLSTPTKRRDVAARVAGLEPPLTLRPGSGVRTRQAELPDSDIAYEMVQGALVRWSNFTDSRPPPTAVMVHGILGSRRNMQSFAHRIVEGFPSWQVLLVDLRCHGESAVLPNSPLGPHGVETAAADVLRLLSKLRLFPEVLIGHSFGGKVVMSMADQFGRRGNRLPRPVHVWVLDALPGHVRAGEADRKDHPADLISALRRLPLPLRDRRSLQDYLVGAGFSQAIARWTSTNLRPLGGSQQRLVWSFDLEGIAQMYDSYEVTSLWPFLQQPMAGISIDFVKAQHSTYRWGGEDETFIRDYGHGVHLLPNSGHWVHSDNPDGLFDILAPSFGPAADLHMQRTSRLRP